MGRTVLSEASAAVARISALSPVLLPPVPASDNSVSAPNTASSPGVRLASFGYFGHMWKLFAMCAWFLVFFSDELAVRGASAGSAAAYATFAVIAVGGLGCWVGGILGDRWGRTRTTAAMMSIPGSCALLIGLLFGGPAWLVLLASLGWGFAVVADSPSSRRRSRSLAIRPM